MRVDLGMSTGKIASQAGHAFLGAAFCCQASSPSVLAEYHRDLPESPGTKVCLRAKSVDALLNVEERAREAGLPVFRVVDSGCANFFDGRPTITALGIGPARKDQVSFLSKLQLLDRVNAPSEEVLA